MSLTFAKHNTKTNIPDIGFKCLYISGKWFAKSSRLFPINIVDTDLSTIGVIYSLPINDQYAMWTPKRYDKSSNLEADSKYWAPIRHGLTLHGVVVDKLFIIDWKRQNVTNLYELNTFKHKANEK